MPEQRPGAQNGPSVLLVAYYFADTRAIGAQRTRALAKFLADGGWRVWVLCAGMNGMEASLLAWSNDMHFDAETEAKAIVERQRRLRQLLVWSRSAWGRSKAWEYAVTLKRALLDRPDPRIQRSWRGAALAAISDPSRAPFAQMVVSSGPPWVAHQVGSAYAERFGVSWIPDYRDLWSNSTYFPHPEWRRLVDRPQERRLLRGAAAVTAATPDFARELEQIAGGKPCVSVLNGYDQDELGSLPCIDLGPGRHIVYAGSWYGDKRNAGPLFAALAAHRELLWTLHLVGTPPSWVLDQIAACGIADRVTLHGEVARQEALSLTAAADVALLLTWNDSRDAGMVPAKLYEYFGLRKAVLCIGYDAGLVADFLHTYGRGCIANDPEEIFQFLSTYSPLDEEGRRTAEVVSLSFERSQQLEKWRDLLHSFEEISPDADERHGGS